ncbi:MAG: pSer/pThr/pTyr-binding forkhead associated (FHA) protein [Chlamydiales bacterium]|jgi:pSer/pThr/pTyr-binding forkhead associated (FHA) protein
MPKLFVLSGPEVGATHAFDGDVDLGRAPGVAVVLRAPSVSRRHARIVQAGDRWFLEDLESVNGTSIERHRVERGELTDGTCFELGELELRFRLDAPAATAPSGSTTVIEAEEPERSPAPDQEPATELELEGDWDSSVPAPAAPEPTQARPPARPARAEVVGTTPRESARAALAATQVRRGEQSTASGGRILQYKNVQEHAGFLSADLGQYPIWVRIGVLVLALAFFVGLAFGAFRLTTTLRTGTGTETSSPSND